MLLKIPAIMSWSGGKDSAYALYNILQQDIYEVKYLISSFDANSKKIAAHGIAENLIEEQAKQMGIALVKIYIPGSSNIEYEKQMAEALSVIKDEGIYHIIYGDIFLEDLRQYREEKLKALNMHAVFPLWKMNTKELLNDFILKGFKAIICCADNNLLDKTWVGKIINGDFINDLPAVADACGENGEYHSFCYDAPFFKKALEIRTGVVTYQSLSVNIAGASPDLAPSAMRGFWYCDIKLPAIVSKHELKPCPNCGKIFECKVGDMARCQCFGIQLNDKAVNFIEKKYGDCLCRNCLIFLNNDNNLPVSIR